MHFQYKITISVVIYRSRKWKCKLMMTNPIINRQDSITSIGMTPYHKSNFKILIFDLDSLYLIHKTSFAPFRKQVESLLCWLSPVLREVKRFNYIRSDWTENWIERSEIGTFFHETYLVLDKVLIPLGDL